jgi:DUF917 family protein
VTRASQPPAPPVSQRSVRAGNVQVSLGTASLACLEQSLRSSAVNWGGMMALALPPMDVRALAEHLIHGTISQSWRLGRAVAEARAAKRDVVRAILEHVSPHACDTLCTRRCITACRAAPAGARHGAVSRQSH